MPDKPWEQMSADEKLDELRRMIKDFIGHSDRNVDAMNAQIGSIRHQLLRIEADLGQLKTDAAVLRKQSAPPS